MTNGTWSPRIGRLIGFVLVGREIGPGTRVEVIKDGAPIMGTLCSLPFEVPST